MALTKVGKGGLDKGSIKDQTNLGASAADADEYLVYDASADALKAITSANVVGSGIITGKDAIAIGNVACVFSQFPCQVSPSFCLKNKQIIYNFKEI